MDEYKIDGKNELVLDFMDENSGEYTCEGPEKEKVYVKFRSKFCMSACV